MNTNRTVETDGNNERTKIREVKINEEKETRNNSNANKIEEIDDNNERTGIQEDKINEEIQQEPITKKIEEDPNDEIKEDLKKEQWRKWKKMI